MNNTIPEPSLTPSDDFYITANCSHEVYTGESLIEWKNAKGKIETLCPDCFWDKIKEMTIEEVAVRFDCGYTIVGG